MKNDLLEKIEILQKIDFYILSQKTGSFVVFARKLKISTEDLFDYFLILENLGVRLAFNNETTSYQYSNKLRLHIAINYFKPQLLDPKLMQKIEDKTLKKIELYNLLDKYIYERRTGKKENLKELLGFKNIDQCRKFLKDFEMMGADFFYAPKFNSYCYRINLRFNFIVKVLEYNEAIRLSRLPTSLKKHHITIKAV